MDPNLSSDLALGIECQHLPSLDALSKSDPYVIAYLYDPHYRVYNQIGRTETVKDNNHPKFVQRIPLKYLFEEAQRLKFEVWDSDSQNHDHDDFAGEMECNVSQIVAGPGSVLRLPITYYSAHNPQKSGKNFSRELSGGQVYKRMPHGEVKQRGDIIIRAETVTNTNVYLNFHPAGIKLDKKDLFGKTDGFLQFFRLANVNSNTTNNENLIKTYETEVVKDTLNPVWKPIRLSLSALANGDVRAPIIVKCFDWDKSGSSEYIGEFKTNLAELVEDQLTALSNSTGTFNAQIPPVNRTFTLVKPLRPSNTKPHGQIVFSNLCVEREYSFLDYLKGGLQMSLMVAVDFTGSNGDPRDHKSLHYRGGSSPNPYQQVIQTIGNIVAPYDHDQQFPVWGFGANINGTVHHCFSLSATPEVYGINGILNAYNATCQTVVLSGPTYFTPIIQTATAVAQSSFTSQQQSYYALLIITDGIINDMQTTIEAIIDASTAPLSIIIIGVGDANFSDMNVLDSDRQPLRGKSGRAAQRDIVQFVEFNKYKDRDLSLLAKETLAELPQQVTQYARMKGIVPLVPVLDSSQPSSSTAVPSYSPAPLQSAPAPQGAYDMSMLQQQLPPQGYPQQQPPPGQVPMYGGAPPQYAPQSYYLPQ